MRLSLVVLVEKKVEGWGNRHVMCIFGRWTGKGEGEDGEVEADDMYKVGDQVDAGEEDYGVRQTVGDCMGFHKKSGVHVRQSRPCRGCL